MSPLFFCSGGEVIIGIKTSNNFNAKQKTFQKKRFQKTEMNLFKNEIFNKISKSVIGASILLTPLVSNALSETKPITPIVDDAGVLTKSSISFLEKNSQKTFETSGSNLYIVSLRTLPYGEDISGFTKDLFLKWGLEDKDVLVVLVNKIAKGSVYAGSNVKGLNDSIIKSIGEETFSFKARDEQYSSAAIDVSNRLVSILTNKGDPGAPSLNRANDSSNFKSAKVTEERRSKYVAIIIILLVIAFVVPMVQFFYYVKDE